MRILIVTDAWSPQVNGVVRTLNALIGELRKKGHEILAITPHGRVVRRFPLIEEIPFTRTSAAEMEREIAAARPDCIHIVTEGTLGWAARRACLRQGWQFTTGFHTRFAEYAAMRLRLPGVRDMGWRVLRTFHEPSRAVMVPTRSIGKELDRRRFSNVKVWTRGVDHQLFKPYPRDHLSFPRPIILYAGRLAVEKGIEDFMRLKIEGTKVLVGDGPARAQLERQNPQAHFLGFRHGEDYARTLASADIMVFPSLTDTFGLVMLEAMACGTPVAAYDAPSPMDVVENGVTGSIAKTLEEAAERAILLDREGVHEGSKKFSWAKCADMFESWLVPCGGATQHPVPHAQQEAFIHLR